MKSARWLCWIVAVCAQTAHGAPDFQLDLDLIVSGLSVPILVTHAGDGSDRLFIVERTGRIRILSPDGRLLESDFLNLGPTGLDLILSTEEPRDERGLLGLAFHPEYASNGRFFVHYSLNSEVKWLKGASVVSEFTVSADPNVANPTETIIYGPLPQPFSNHNGGMIAFNPRDEDCPGCLYIALGDGGSANDPLLAGQDIQTPLGKILRIDVDSGDPYSIPPDNPFVGREGLDEIFAYGLRNVWRFSFDRENGRLFAGDVGQATREEVDLVVKGGNYGWNIMEGFSCFSPETGCATEGLTLPIAQYDHPAGCSITGGYVYRGTAYPRMSGHYFYGDYCVGRIWSIKENLEGDGWDQPVEHMYTNILISSFGEDERGELYLTEGMVRDGKVYQLIDRTAEGDGSSKGSRNPSSFPYCIFDLDRFADRLGIRIGQSSFSR